MDISCGVPEAPALKESSVCCGPAEGFHTKDVKTEGKQVPKHACFFPLKKKKAAFLEEEKLNSWLCLHFLRAGTPAGPTVGCPGPSLSRKNQTSGCEVAGVAPRATAVPPLCPLQRPPPIYLNNGTFSVQCPHSSEHFGRRTTPDYP